MSFFDEPIHCNGLIADIIVSRCRWLTQRRVRLLGKDICPRRMGFDVEHDFGFQFWIVQHQLRVDGTIVMCEIDVGGSYEDAATFLLEAFPLEAPNYSEAFRVMVHSSWKRDDQIRLARCYLRKMPFASVTPYEAFASFMSLRF